ncbi:MAG TPA: dihydrolipoamide acetyltransferase family protein [Caulobacteraceae bacterium]|nr:dihydrolipoamide acetyltransferase family protein [Caulobacteraceae bacterium]
MIEYAFRLPDVGEGTTEAEIVAWHIAPGDRIEEDAPLVDVMTEKATVEMTSPVTGVVVSIAGEPGDTAAVGSTLAVIAVEGEAPAPQPARAETQAGPPPHPAGRSPGHPPHEGEGERIASPPPPGGGGGEAAGRGPPPQPSRPGAKPLASPAVRRRALEAGVALQQVPGTGPAGRITPEDLAAFLAGGGAAARVGRGRREGVTEVKVIGLRRRIAEKMRESKRRIPHYAYVEEVDVTELEALRLHLNAGAGEGRPRLTILPFIVTALTRLLPEFPQINATFDDEAGIVHRHAPIHVGIATQTPNGLVVPVVRHAEAMGLYELAAEIAARAAAAREGTAKSDELRGSTITVTSLGPLGGVATTPVINHPEVAIIGPNKVLERPVVHAGAIAVRKMMNLSSSFDHRVVDGYDAAAFIQQVKAMLEHPALLFLDG